ncbi:hypothetical protein CPB84DRAFT_1817135 [Gymnopilus junonius]|uniref:Protein kinase domain-containing protein n=1 Tax=Gymnopilus junonius TaxID=109634 RepID=A0A9P5NF48_GYMJU|nr:hypothetical protein CPB84DRAFT_1817135 [Gymnopilus junonius]
MQKFPDSPPRAPPIKYKAPLGTRWDKEKAAAGGAAAFDLPTDPKTIGPWILGECVGKGASGRVKIARHRRTGQLAAVKILPVAPLVNSRASLATQQAKSEKQRLGIDREITMMKLMNHPNIMRIYDVYEGDKELFLVLEYVEGGELFDFLVNRGRLPPNEALIYFKQINILIASLSPPQIKIADWGMAAFAPPSLQLETSCGSPHYASPEIVNGEKYQGNATDIWSCGVILYALLTGRLPFDDKNVRNLLTKVKSGKYDMPSWIDPLAKDLLSKMLIVDVSQRITIPEILSHPWLVSHMTIPFTSMDGATFTLLAPPLPPSPSILARPIASPDIIDSELFSSLRIIWGRHSDPEGESIKRDLCAPAGQGIHAKAFYFLLGKYREEAYRNRSNDNEHDSQSTIAGPTIDLEAIRFNLDWELDHDNSVNLKKYQVPQRVFSTPRGLPPNAISSNGPPYPPSLSAGFAPGIGSRKRTFTDGSIPTKDRPDSPHGPRPPMKASGDAWLKAHGQSERISTSGIPVANNARPKSSMGAGRGGPRPFPPRRGFTHSLMGEGRIQNQKNDGVGGTAIGFSQHLQQLQARAVSNSLAQRPKSSAVLDSAFIESEKRPLLSLSPATSVDHGRQSSSPVLSPNCSMVIDNADGLPLLTAPKMDNPHLQRTMDDITQRVNELVQAVTQAPSGKDVLVREAIKPPPVQARIQEDKENRSLDEESWSHVSAETDPSGGLGLSVPVNVDLNLDRDMGRDVLNISSNANTAASAMTVTMSPTRARKEKEKKARPPPLELPSLNGKRVTTLGMLGSPITLSSPFHPPPPSSANRILASPVVGEFKGWFSNLFNWKHSNGHGGVLYSSDEIHHTRSNVARILDGLGITLATSSGGMGYSDLAEILFCRLEQPRTDPATGISLKNVRFRVEFRAQPPAGSLNDPQTILSPTIEENSQYLVSSPNSSHHFSQLVTPTLGNASRSRASILLGRGSSHASGTPLSSPIPGPMPLQAKWDLPPGCACVIVLVHEKGSMSTFRAVWRRLKDEYGSTTATYPCFSPAMPPTPYTENYRMPV